MPRLSIILLILTFYGGSVIGQNLVTKDGEFMDTAVNENTNAGGYTIYYYSVGGKYPRSSATLLEELKAHLAASRTAANSFANSGSGYITFRFVIDSTGQMRQGIRVIQTDEHYKDFHFEKALVNELFEFLKTLDKWKAVRSRDGRSFNYIALMTFKIQNGKVVNIIP